MCQSDPRDDVLELPPLNPKEMTILEHQESLNVHLASRELGTPSVLKKQKNKEWDDQTRVTVFQRYSNHSIPLYKELPQSI